MSEEAVASSDFATIKEMYNSGEELSDEQIDTIADTALSIIKSLLACFGENNCSIDEYDGNDGELILDITGGNLAILIGRHGVTLDALQTIFTSMLSKKIGFHYPIVIDVEGYKSRRRDKVQSIAVSSAQKALKTERSVRLAPMNAYERRLVHLALRGNDNVTTHSEGTDPDRCVVITPIKK